VILRPGLSHNVTRSLAIFYSEVGRWLRVITLRYLVFCLERSHSFAAVAKRNSWSESPLFFIVIVGS
jgi:hypothetical protein